MADRHEIDWYVCRASSADVAAFAESGGTQVQVGDEFWRVPRRIGPVVPDSNHWAGSHLSGDHKTWAQMSAAPLLEAALRSIVQSHRAGQTPSPDVLRIAESALDAARPDPSWK